MKRRHLPTTALAALAALAALRASAQPAARLTIAAASDLRFALDELLQPWRTQADRRIEVIYGSSGKLATQIANGAPFDVFLSADVGYAQQLHDAGLTTAPPRRYALGRLALFSADAELGRLPLAEVVRHPRVRRFAIANPEHAPYGRRAIEALRSQGLEAEVRERLVLGDNVSQAATFIETGAAQAGIVAYSLVLAPALAGRGAWTLLPAGWHRPLEQTLVVMRRAASPPLADDFVALLLSPAGRERLRRNGFETPDDPARASR